MSKPLKPRRGTTAENNAFVGEAYEVTYDTDKNTLVCRDGLTAGGFPLAKEEEVSSLDSTLRAFIAQEVAKAMAAANAAQSSADAAQSSLIDYFPLDASEMITGTPKVQHSQFASGTLPSTTSYRALNFTDKNGTVVNRLLSYVNINGSAGISIGTNNYKGDGGLKALGVSINEDGTPYFTAGGNDILAEDALVKQANKGYMRLTNGLLLHWGYVTSTTQVVTINFSPAFSSITSYVCIPFSAIGGDSSNYNPNIVRSSASKATFNSMIGKAASGFYIAIGY